MLRRSDDSHDGALRMGSLEVATLGIQPLSEAHRGRRFETCQSMKALYLHRCYTVEELLQRQAGLKEQMEARCRAD